MEELSTINDNEKVEQVEITDGMAYAFHNAIGDGSLGDDEVEEIKTGLRAAFANIEQPDAHSVWRDIVAELLENDGGEGSHRWSATRWLSARDKLRAMIAAAPVLKPNS